MNIESIFTRVCTITFIVIISACAPIKVVTQYDVSVDFNKLKTYKLQLNTKKNEGRLSISSNVLFSSLESAFSQELISKGFSAAAHSADFILSYHVVTNVAKVDTNTGTQTPVRASANIFEFPTGTLIVDILDGQTNRKIWYGVASTPVGAQKEEDKKIQLIYAAVNKVLIKFPP